MTETQQARSGIVRPLLLAVAGAAVLAGAVLYALHTGEQVRPLTPPTPAAEPAKPSPAATDAATPAAPSFDIVRINKAGDAVMAGRAAPGAKVTVNAGGKPVGTATADPSGQWVFLPSTPLGPGGHQLTLSEELPGGTKIPGKSSVLLVVPPGATAGTEMAGAAAPEGPVAVLTSPSGPQVMQGAAPAEAGGVGVSAIEYGDTGRLHIAGIAPPDARLRLFLDNHEIGALTAGPGGQWALVPGLLAAPGAHTLKVQRIGPDGAVQAEIARAFDRAAPGAPALAAGQVVVVKGQSLWLIARAAYGDGLRYTIIFRANRAKIRDPNLIYPGQTFTLPAGTLPAGSLPAATPSSSSKSR